MDGARRQRIKDSFHSLSERLPEVVQGFYSRLFMDHPDLREMYPQDMEQQRNYLITALALIVKNVDNIAVMEAPLREMGRRHLGYGARPEHYPRVRDAMVGALADGAGASWTAPLEADWRRAIDIVAAMMLEGAAEAERDRLAP